MKDNVPSYRKAAPRQGGIGLVTAIFLLVVLAGLAIAMVGVFSSQQTSSNADLQGARAYQAARAGVEWGLYQALRNNSCKGGTLSFPAQSTLAGFTTVVTCTQVGANPSDGSKTLTRYVISAMACNMVDASGGCSPQNNPDYVMRQVETEV